MNRRLIFAVAAVAVLLRLAAFWAVGPTTGGTAFYYEAVAQSLLKGKGFSYYPHYIVNYPKEIPKSYKNLAIPVESVGAYLPADPKLHERAPLYRYPPAYPMFLAAVHWIFGPNPGPVVLVQIFLNALVVLMVARIAFLAFQSSVIASLSAVAYAVWPFTLINSLAYEPTALLYVTVIGAVWALMEFRERGGMAWLVLSGALCGVSAMLRTDALFAVFGLAASCLIAPAGPIRKKIAHAALVLVITAAVMAPWLIRNYAVHGRFVSLSCGLGVNLIIGIGKYIPDSGFPAYDRKLIEEEYGADYVSGPYYTDDGCYPDGVGREQERTKRAIAWIKDHPAAFAWSCIRRAPDLFFVGLETAGRRLRAGASALKQAAAFALAWFEPVVFVIAVAGTWFARRRWMTACPLVIVVILYALGHLPMWVEPRYFKPVWPLILMFACAALVGRRTFDITASRK